MPSRPARSGLLHGRRPKNAERASRFLRRAGVAGRVTVLVGDALTLLRATPGQFDIIFNDVDK